MIKAFVRHYPDGTTKQFTDPTTVPMAWEDVHRGLSNGNYIYYMVRLRGDVKHGYLCDIDNPKVKKIPYLAVVLTAQSGTDIRDIRMPKSYYRKDKHCEVNGEMYIMTSARPIAPPSRLSPTTRYNCQI